MHIPNWRTRWERHQRQGGTRPYYPATYLYERLNFLANQEWVYRIKRAAQYGKEKFAAEPDLYGLLEEGALVLSAYQHRPVDTIHYDRKRVRSLFNINHTADVATFYAALRTRVQWREGLHLLGWQGDHLIARSYDRLDVRRLSTRGNMETVQLPVQPDGTFVLQHAGGQERVFVEIDRGTRPLISWIEKIQAYAAYQGSPELKARYGVSRFMLLSVTSDETQIQAIMQATAGVLGKPNGRYLFALHADVHPTTIATAWRKLATITPSGTPSRPAITTEPHTLIQ